MRPSFDRHRERRTGMTAGSAPFKTPKVFSTTVKFAADNNLRLGPGPPGVVKRPRCSYVNSKSVLRVDLCGNAGRLTARNISFWPGQF